MKFTAWNIEGRLSRFAEPKRRGSPEQIVEQIKRHDSDVLFLPEAYDYARGIEPSIALSLKAMGYKAVDVAYAEHKRRDDGATIDPHTLFLSRIEVVRMETIRPGGIRNMQVIDVKDPKSGQIVRVFGIHLDDRTEARRLRQVQGIIQYCNDSPFPVIAGGDFNAMYEASRFSRLLRHDAAQEIIKYIPSSTLSRLSEMAIGDTLSDLLEATNLRDIDPQHRPTTTPKMRGREYMPSIRLAQIDHIFVSPELIADDFSIAPDAGSDHRALSAKITVI